jgi:hypothetical protein
MHEANVVAAFYDEDEDVEDDDDEEDAKTVQICRNMRVQRAEWETDKAGRRCAGRRTSCGGWTGR